MTTVKRKSKQLGQILIEQGLITAEQLDTPWTSTGRPRSRSAGS